MAANKANYAKAALSAAVYFLPFAVAETNIIDFRLFTANCRFQISRACASALPV